MAKKLPSVNMQPGDFFTHNLTHNCGACWAFLSLNEINRSSSILNGFNDCVRYYCQFSDRFYAVKFI